MEYVRMKLWVGAAVFATMVGISGCNDSGGTSKASDPPTTSSGTVSTDATIASAADQPDAARFALEDTLTALNAVPSGQALTSTTTVNCPGGGTVTVEKTVGSTTGPTQGDSYKSTYTNCVTFGSTKINGTSAFTIVTLSGDPTLPNSTWSIKTSATTDLTVASSLASRALKGTHTFTASATAAGAHSRAIVGDSTQTVTPVAAGSTPRTETSSADTALNWNTSTLAYDDTVALSHAGGFGGNLKVETPTKLTGTLTVTAFTFTPPGSTTPVTINIPNFKPPTAGKVKITRTTTGATPTTTVTTYTANSDGTATIQVDAAAATTGPWPASVLALLGLR